MNNFHPNRAVQDQLAFLGTEDPKTVAAVAVSSERENVLIKKERTGTIFPPPPSTWFCQTSFSIFKQGGVGRRPLRSDRWEAFDCHSETAKVWPLPLPPFRIVDLIHETSAALNPTLIRPSCRHHHHHRHHHLPTGER